MPLLGWLARLFLLRRLMGGHRRRPHRRGRVGFFGPAPYYSRRTRSGARVSVGGCCLPIPLLVLTSTAGAAVASLRRHRQSSAR